MKNMILGLLALGILSVWSLAAAAAEAGPSGAAPQAEKARAPLSSDLIDRVASVTKPGAFVGIVSFKTSMVKMTVTTESTAAKGTMEHREAELPESSWFGTGEEGKPLRHVLRVKGDFTLIKRLAGEAPAVGKVDKTIDYAREGWGRGWTIPDPLLDLANCIDSQPLLTSKKGEEPRPVAYYFVVTSPSHVESVMDCWFTGPIAEQDVPYVEGLAKFLLAQKGEIKTDLARTLLTDKNPALVMYGLDRLRKPPDITADDFLKAIKGVELPYVRVIYDKAAHHAATDKAFADQFAKGLSEVSKAADAQRQAAILAGLKNDLKATGTGNLEWDKAILKYFPELKDAEPEKASAPVPATPEALAKKS
jgi:hypothetical protein